MIQKTITQTDLENYLTDKGLEDYEDVFYLLLDLVQEDLSVDMLQDEIRANLYETVEEE